MKIKILTALIVILCTYASYMVIDEFFVSKQVKLITHDQTFQELPPLKFTDIQGKPVLLNEFKDNIILFNFWASWCPPCIKEFPSLINLVKQHKGNIKLVAISSDDKKEDLQSFLQKQKFQDPNIFIVWDSNQETTNKLLVKKLPETFIIKNNKIIKKASGFENWTSKYWLDYFNNL
ncbi:MAG: TlpA family protein disulfide reductase [Bdellovibrionaceae bacterium]|jgi:thiol-disulfide isomerase/thioredoxin|nr:TlpA family protein disulfide reductase [Pseudobdellovibrionaceae bacterium]